MPPAAENPFRGDFGEMWLEVVAAGAGILHGRATTLDFEKADVELVLREVVAGTSFPTVKAQVKATSSWRLQENGDLVYGLDVATYDVLRRTDHAVRRVLVVVALPAEGDLVRTTADGTLLIGDARWTSLEGAPATENTVSISIALPKGQVIDPTGLRLLLQRHGVRMPTPVNDVIEWNGGGSGG